LQLINIIKYSLFGNWFLHSAGKYLPDYTASLTKH
jgi:hypothetical protein